MKKQEILKTWKEHLKVRPEVIQWTFGNELKTQRCPQRDNIQGVTEDPKFTKIDKAGGEGIIGIERKTWWYPQRHSNHTMSNWSRKVYENR